MDMQRSPHRLGVKEMFACTAQDLATQDYSINNEDDAQQRVQLFLQ